MKRMYIYLKYTWWQALLAISIVITRVSLDLSLPDYMSQMIDEGILKNNQAVIAKIGLNMLLTALAVMVLFMIGSYLAAYIGSTTAHIIRKDLYRKIESFSLVEFDHFSSASLITRATNDVAQIQQILTMSFRVMLAAPLYGTIALLKAIQINSHMALVFAFAIPLVFGIILTLFHFTNPRFERVQRLTDRLNRLFRESLLGIRVIRAFNAQSHQSEKLTSVSKDVTVNNIRLVRVMGLMEPSIQITMSLGILILLWLGSSAIANSSLQIGQMMAFIQYATQVTTSLLTLSMVMAVYPKADVSGKRIAEILDSEPTIVDSMTPQYLNSDAITVHFNNVSFTYPKASQEAVKSITFTAQPNTVTAIIGSTGSGKSTLMNLMMRLYDPSVGDITLNGINIKDIPQHDLHNTIAFIPQKNTLLSGTLMNALSMGKEEAEEALWESLDMAQAKSFIESTSEQLNHPIVQGATNLSGGQKQRLAIARALLLKAPVLLFDDSFSALDFKTDKALRHALHTNLKNSTVFIVGQRVSSVMNSDQIIVMDKGECVAIGKHHELLKSCAIYQEIASSQLTAEELV